MKQMRNHQNEALSAIAQAVHGIINLPTGTGKSLIQSRSTVDHIKQNQESLVYVILSPRILLSNQLMADVRNDLMLNSIDCQYMVVHSGHVNDDMSKEDAELMDDLDLPFREMPSSTRHEVIRETYEKAQRQQVPLVVSGTYHSAERLRGAGIPIEAVFCDEAHYLVSEQFGWIASDPFPANQAFYFTATLRNTRSEDGRGMNNERLFGPILAQKTPKQMIEAGETVRPRLHFVDMSDHPAGDEGDGLAVAEAFRQHVALINVGAKLLVVAKDGSDHLDAIARHNEIERLREVRPRLRVFDISSAHGPRIDGECVNRLDFLTRLRALDDNDEAIVIHHDILTEGIDVPGITGVMPFTGQSRSKFMQTLGRATRLHVTDRAKLYGEKIAPEQTDRMIKPHAWIIVPVYGEFGEDFREEVMELIDELRAYGFDPSEDVFIRPARGRPTPEPIGTVNEPTRRERNLLEFTTEVVHTLEERKKADQLASEVRQYKDQPFEDKLHDGIGGLI